MKSIGDRLKEYRLKRGMSRKNLAEGICNETTLLRIESEKHEPRINTLIEICKKLEVPFNYILNTKDESDQRLINEVKLLCREYVYNQDYDALQLLINEIEISIEKLRSCDPSFERFFLLHKAILEHEMYNNLQQAEDQILRIFPQSEQFLDEIDISVANSLGYIYIEKNQFEKASQLLVKVLKVCEELPSIEDKTLYVRIGYNYIYSQYYLDNYDEVIVFGKMLFEHMKTFHLSYMFGRINHLLAVSFEKEMQLHEAERHMKIAAYHFQSQENLYYYIKCTRALAEIQFKAGKKEKGIESLKYVKENLHKITLPNNFQQLINEMNEKYLDYKV